jgi:hypothetical protein
MIRPPPTKSPLGAKQAIPTGFAINKTQEDYKKSLQQTISPEWAEFFSDIYFAIVGMQQSGTTANRPTKRLYVGMPYFDTTLNRPIWYTGTNWIRADGVVV